MGSESEPAALRRSLSLPMLVLYGVGTTVGAGIYALMGEVAARAGAYAPVSFALASALAACTAGAFVELAARYPRSAGEAVYVEEGLRSPRLALLVGLLVVLAGSVSSAAIANGFVGYLGEVLSLPRAASILAIVLALGAVAAWGIQESVAVAGIITAIELAGLLLVIGFGAGDALGSPRLSELVAPPDPAVWLSITSASVLAFYAFLGFEDMVNVAEEVKDVRRTLPAAIIVTLVVTTVLFVLTALVCVLVVSPEELSESKAPLVLVYDRSGGIAPPVLRFIGVVAMVNGALIQMIMASRVLYGLADQGSLPALLARVHPHPHAARRNDPRDRAGRRAGGRIRSRVAGGGDLGGDALGLRAREPGALRGEGARPRSERNPARSAPGAVRGLRSVRGIPRFRADSAPPGLKARRRTTPASQSCAVRSQAPPSDRRRRRVAFGTCRAP